MKELKKEMSEFGYEFIYSGHSADFDELPSGLSLRVEDSRIE